MRIVHVIHHPGQGGMERYAYLLAKYAIKSGHQVDFIFGENGPLVESVKSLGCNVYMLKMRAPYDPIAVSGLVKIFKKSKPDIVHTHFMRENFLVIDASKFVHIPAIFSTVHRLEKKNVLQAAVNKLYSKSLTKFIAVSPLAKEYLMNEGVRESKIVTALNGAEIGKIDRVKIRKEVGLTGDDLVITYVGRFTEEKGHKTLLKAFSILKESKSKLVLVGDGELRAEMKKYAEKLKIGDRVIFTGNRDNAYEITGVSDLYIQPSEVENMPLSVAEAMLLGVPIVASDCMAHKYLLKDGKYGTIFKNKNAKSLASAIETGLSGKQVLAMTDAAREYAELHLTVEKMWETTQMLYEKYANSSIDVLR